MTFVTKNKNNEFICIDDKKKINYYYDNEDDIYKECFHT